MNQSENKNWSGRMLGSIPLTWRTKLGAAVLTACLMQANAMAFGQRVTVKMKDVTVVSLLKEIRKQSNADVFYDAKTLNDNYKVSVDLKNADIKEVLELALKGLPLTYQVTTEGITIRKGQHDVLVTKGTEVQATIDMEGRIVGQNGQALGGATVSVKGTNKSIQTNSNGNFVLKNVQDGEILVISYVGYLTKELIGRPQLGNIVLTMLDNPLDAVQVIGYGKTSKRLTTGAVATVRAEDLEKQPVSNPLQALSGRVAGVYISEGSGIAGSQVKVEIRGKNTIKAGQNPLYIVDGVPFSATPTEQTSGNPVVNGIVGGGFSPLDNIPSSDIESIDILKDADATAIYGSRAANGVVIITTKKGKAGEMKIGANIYSGVSQMANRLKMLSKDEYIAVRKKAFENDNLKPTAANAPDLLTFGDGETDFIDYVYGNLAGMIDATATVSGGSNQYQYFVSANHRTQNSIFPYSFQDKKSSVRFNMQTQSANSKFFMNFSGGYTKNINNLPSASLSAIYALPPNLPLYKDDGSFYWHNSYVNPAAALLGPMESVTDNMLLNSSLKYVIIPGLELKTELGFNRINNENYRAMTRNSRNPNTMSTGQLSYNNNYNQNFSIEPQLTYQRILGPGRMEALIGGTYLNSVAGQPLFLIGSFTNDALYRNLASVNSQVSLSGYTSTRYVSAFTRLNYVMSNKYILNVNARRDGSSRFGPGNRFGNFGSIGAAWIFGEEHFMKENLAWLSFGKVRGSYGTIGNDPNQDYAYLATYAASSFATHYNGVASLVPETLPNEDFKWEVTRKLDFALDLNFLQDKISFSAGWYRNRSNNLLIDIPVAAQTGFATYLENLPALVQNKGWEFNLMTKNIDRGHFSWSTSINFTAAKNTLLNYPGLAKSSLNSEYVVGQPLSVALGYHLLGFENGIAKFQDMDGNGSITTGVYETTGKGDEVVLGHSDPKFFGGVNNSFNYKGFALDFLFSFVKKDGFNIYHDGMPYIPGNAYNAVADVLNQPFRLTTLRGGEAATSYNRWRASDGTFKDASYIRLKNVSLTYQFEPKQVKSLGLKNLSVYLRGQNLWTASKYIGFDPETQGMAGIPPLKVYTIGLHTTL